MICQNCNTENIEGAVFCSKCGTKIVLENTKRKCAQCGGELNDDDCFCVKCGLSVTNTLGIGDGVAGGGKTRCCLGAFNVKKSQKKLAIGIILSVLLTIIGIALILRLVCLTENKTPKDGECRKFILPGGVEMYMVYVAPGEFTTCSTESKNVEERRFSRIGPQYHIKLTEGYWIAKYPITQAQWNGLVKKNNIKFKDSAGADIESPIPHWSSIGKGSISVQGIDTSDFPMDSISWNDCDILVKALNKEDQSSRIWLMPTEAQWEFAARGGNKSKGYIYSGSDVLDEVGWYYENFGEKYLDEGDYDLEKARYNKGRLHSVKEKDVGNELGIVGMSGNICEWCRDWCMDYYQGYENGGFVVNPCNEEQTGFRVMRSGTCFEPSFTSRNSSRRGKRPYGRKGYFGFRLACIMR